VGKKNDDFTSIRANCFRLLIRLPSPRRRLDKQLTDDAQSQGQRGQPAAARRTGSVNNDGGRKQHAFGSLERLKT